VDNPREGLFDQTLNILCFRILGDVVELQGLVRGGECFVINQFDDVVRPFGPQEKGDDEDADAAQVAPDEDGQPGHIAYLDLAEVSCL